MNQDRSSRYRLVRGGSRGGAVDGCVGGEHGADHSPAWGTNHDANKGANSARGPTEETGVRAGAGGGANARPDDSADHKADQGMLSPRLGPEDVETRATSSRFTETSEPFSFRVSNSSVTVTNFPGVALHAGFDHFDSLAGLQAI